ncbi:uncharacterized protein LOC129742382 [Uranotaenia lowii]|uniref:uncharacterized protein LOC129742382 n=1 Tax=Uranotaenia lowii TaxID=190385 RepID=UPI00247ACC85|nr:uncharacterized protein LOC129742382 [Uranotaenia lowii]
MIDERLSFASHVDYVCKRTAAAALIRMMSNSSANRSSKRRILSSVTTSILWYGAAAWRQALERQCNLQRLSSVQRLMNRRTKPPVVAGFMPISVLLEKDVASSQSEVCGGTYQHTCGLWARHDRRQRGVEDVYGLQYLTCG